MNLLIRDWHRKIWEISAMYQDFVRVCSAISAQGGWLSEEEEVRYWEVAWHGYALQGVCQSLGLILAYIDGSTHNVAFPVLGPVWNLYMSACFVYRDRKRFFSSYTGRTVPLAVPIGSSSVGKQLDR